MKFMFNVLKFAVYFTVSFLLSRHHRGKFLVVTYFVKSKVLFDHFEHQKLMTNFKLPTCSWWYKGCFSCYNLQNMLCIKEKKQYSGKMIYRQHCV
ncbi:hypothetical protein BpHYR1_027505 [Brachionus plicatilis]|uniref:Uncharacterized protein n=1 Tax=Brachionus plicatilis TaxID=10195 RepID=A0A3M7RZ29_BRAPC|nr:hypothetical protein BpHYR1_027505 [Brachionus plicatilis]